MGIPPPIEQANLGMADSLILMVLALVVFGPRRLPQIGRQIGKLMYEFRKASNDFKFQMEEELRSSEEADRRKREEAERQRVLALNPPAPASSAETVAEEAPSGLAAEPETPSSATESPLPPEDAHSDLARQESQPEESYPRILPPSTGEIVAAARPGSGRGESAEAHPASPDPDIERAGETSSEVTEQAAHNG
ncbi:MAG TPA: twin-arginine translocase TatA/TatE family subunit [Terracidiphilus sp.]|jgi:sec-independent protein translocase protein TatB